MALPAPLKLLPNAITLLRAVLIPVIAFEIVQHDYDSALLLFVLCALGDFVDGWLARAFDLRTRFGAIADPLADKLTMLTVTLLLAWQGLPNGVFWIEAALITQFAVFWVIQSRELWHDGVRTQPATPQS